MAEYNEDGSIRIFGIPGSKVQCVKDLEAHFDELDAETQKEVLRICRNMRSDKMYLLFGHKGDGLDSIASPSLGRLESPKNLQAQYTN